MPQTTSALVFQFGRLARPPISEPGLYFRIPFIESVQLIDKRVLDNDLRSGEFAQLVRRSPWAVPLGVEIHRGAAASQGQADSTDVWWAERGASRHEVMSDWRFDARHDFEAVLRMETPAEIADPWLASNPDRRHLS